MLNGLLLISTTTYHLESLDLTESNHKFFAYTPLRLLTITKFYSCNWLTSSPTASFSIKSVHYFFAVAVVAALNLYRHCELSCFMRLLLRSSAFLKPSDDK